MADSPCLVAMGMISSGTLGEEVEEVALLQEQHAAEQVRPPYSDNGAF